MSTELRHYANRYENVRMEREDGILLVQLHSDGGPLKWCEPAHRELPLAFHDIGADRENRVVILTGTGEVYCDSVDFASFGTTRTAEDQDRIMREGRQLIQRLLDIDVPILGVVNGPARIHSELPVMSDVVIAADHAVFQDGVHFTTGGVCGDGMHVLWPLLLGLNRGRAFLMEGTELTAHQALDFGVVAETHPLERLMDRAWEIARRWNERPYLSLRYQRQCMTLLLKQAFATALNEGLALESLGRLAIAGTYPILRDTLGPQAHR